MVCVYLVPRDLRLGNSNDVAFKNDFLVGENLARFQLRRKLRSKFFAFDSDFFCNVNPADVIVKNVIILLASENK